MTDSPNAPPVVVGDLERALGVVRGAGLRASAARRLLLEALFAAEGPVSAERLARQVTASSSGDLASVYRNLELFERLGLVRHVHLGHGPGLYALAGEGEREYLVCERCAAVRTVEPARLDPARERIRRDFGFAVRFSHFPLTGTCDDCARSLERPRDAPSAHE